MEYIAVMPHSQAFEDSLKRACLTPKAMEQAKKISQESGADALICAQDASMDGIELSLAEIEKLMPATFSAMEKKQVTDFFEHMGTPARIKEALLAKGK